MLSETHKYENPAKLLKALAHPTRLCIVAGLLSGPCNVSKIKDCLNLPQSTVSQQLAILRSQGIVGGVRNGTEVFYQVIDDRVEQVLKALLDSNPPLFFI